jgi:hypothetical protein
MSLMHARRTSLLGAVILLSAAAPALGAGLSSSQAHQAAAKAAEAVRVEVHAARVKLMSCSRRGGGKFTCGVEARYTSGARRCTFEVVVTPPPARGQRPRTSAANFVCY